MGIAWLLFHMPSPKLLAETTLSSTSLASDARGAFSFTARNILMPLRIVSQSPISSSHTLDVILRHIISNH
jgi:hypothetical protein